MGYFNFLKNQTESMVQFLEVFLKGQSYLKRDTQRFVLSTEPFLRDISGPRYLKNNSEVLVND